MKVRVTGRRVSLVAAADPGLDAVADAQRAVARLEPKLARAIQAALERLAEDAAEGFLRHVTNTLTAAGEIDTSLSPKDIADLHPLEAIQSQLSGLIARIANIKEVQSAARTTVAAIRQQIQRLKAEAKRLLALDVATPEQQATVEKQVQQNNAQLGQHQQELRKQLKELHDGAAFQREVESESNVLQKAFKLAKDAARAAWIGPNIHDYFPPSAVTPALAEAIAPIQEAAQFQYLAKAQRTGVSFDAVNAYVNGLIQTLATRITGISATTQSEVQVVVNKAYHDGLSIPQTADEIRTKMKAAAATRAKTIARTEMTALQNGGALAMMQAMDKAGVGKYAKRWLTAPGAEHPRHEDYEDLDGQTVLLDELFQVGEAQLAFPGDPSGPADEVINCRCTLVWVPAAEAELEGQGDGIPDAAASVFEDTMAPATALSTVLPEAVQAAEVDLGSWANFSGARQMRETLTTGSTKEVTAMMRDVFPDTKFNISAMGDEGARTVAKGLFPLLDRYPGVHVNMIDTLAAERVAKAMSPSTVAFVLPQGLTESKITFNLRFVGKEPKIVGGGPGGSPIERGWWPRTYQDDPLQAVAEHEFGHALHRAYFPESYQGYESWDRIKEIKTIAGWKKLGGYAATNDREAFAEVFQMMTDGRTDLLTEAQQVAVGEMRALFTQEGLWVPPLETEKLALQMEKLPESMLPPMTKAWSPNPELTSLEQQLERDFPGTHFQFQTGPMELTVGDAKAIAREYKQLAAAYPEVAARMNYVGVDMAAWTREEVTSGMAAFTLAPLGQIHFNPLIYSKEAALETKGFMEYSAQKGWYPSYYSGRPMEALLDHEFGHMVDSVYGGQTAQGELLSQHLKPADGKLFAKTLGEYAATSTSEGAAEAFAAIAAKRDGVTLTTEEQRAATRLTNRMKVSPLYPAPTVAEIRAVQPFKLGHDLQQSFGHEAFVELERTGGFSLNADGQIPTTKRFVTALGTEHEQVFLPGTTTYSGVFSRYATEKAQVLQENPGSFLGGWKDPVTGKVYLDVSTSFQDLDQALRYAGAHGQKNIWDAVGKKTVSVPEAYFVNTRSISAEGFLPAKEPRFAEQIPPEAVPPGWYEWQDALTPGELKAIHDYTGSDFSVYNDFARTGQGPLDLPNLGRDVAALDRAIAKAPRYPAPVTVWRRFTAAGDQTLYPTFGRHEGEAVGDWAKRVFTPGEVLNPGGFQSATFRPYWQSVPDSILFEIRTDHGAFLANEGLSNIPQEQELLLGSNTRYRIVRVLPEVRFEREPGNFVTQTVVQVEAI